MTKIKGNVVNLIPKIVIAVIILGLLAAVVIFYFTTFQKSETSFACTLGLQKCEAVVNAPTQSAGNMISAISCAYYRCTLGCNSNKVAGINVDIVNKADGGLVTVNCKADLCLPYADKDNKVCDPDKGAFAVSYQKSILDVRAFNDREFDAIDLNDGCAYTSKISLRRSDVKDAEGKELCKSERSWIIYKNVKSCNLNSGIYEVKTGVIKGTTSTCRITSLQESKAIAINKFSLFDIKPNPIPANGEFQASFGGFPDETKSIVVIFDNKPQKTYPLDSPEKVITKNFKVGEDIPATKGTFSMQLKAIGQFGNVVGITDLVEVRIE